MYPIDVPYVRNELFNGHERNELFKQKYELFKRSSVLSRFITAYTVISGELHISQIIRNTSLPYHIEISVTLEMSVYTQYWSNVRLIC